MEQRLLGQYRRVFFAAVFGAISASIWAGPGLPGLIGGLFGAALAYSLISIRNSERSLVESMSVAGLLAATFTPATASVPQLIALILCSGIVIDVLVYQGLFNRIGLRIRVTHRQTLRVAMSLGDLWKRLLPDAGHPDDYWGGGLVDYDHDSDDPDTLYLRLSAPDGSVRDVTFTYLSLTPQSLCRYYQEWDDDDGLQTMTVTLQLRKTGDGQSQLTRIAQQSDLPLGLGLRRWFDGALYDQRFAPANTTLVARLGVNRPRFVTQRLAFGQGITFDKRLRLIDLGLR